MVIVHHVQDTHLFPHKALRIYFKVQNKSFISNDYDKLKSTLDYFWWWWLLLMMVIIFDDGYLRFNYMKMKILWIAMLDTAICSERLTCWTWTQFRIKMMMMRMTADWWQQWWCCWWCDDDDDELRFLQLLKICYCA